jgi:hypothetical protein
LGERPCKRGDLLGERPCKRGDYCIEKKLVKEHQDKNLENKL